MTKTTKAAEIIAGFKFDRDISVGKCLWGKSWTSTYKGVEITMDAISTLVANEFIEKFSIYPDTYSWITDEPEFDPRKYLPIVTTEDKLKCSIYVIEFWQASGKFSDNT